MTGSKWIMRDAKWRKHLAKAADFMIHFSAELGTPKKGQRLPSLQGRNACPFSSLSSSAWNVHIFTKNVLHLQLCRYSQCRSWSCSFLNEAGFVAGWLQSGEALDNARSDLEKGAVDPATPPSSSLSLLWSPC